MYPRISREQRRKLLTKQRAGEAARTVGVTFGAEVGEGSLPPSTPDYYKISPEDRRVLEKAIDDTRSPDPSLASRAKTALNNAMNFVAGESLLSRALAGTPLGGAARLGAILGIAFAGFKVRGDFNFSDGAAVFRGTLGYNDSGTADRGLVIVTKASYDSATGKGIIEAREEAPNVGCRKDGLKHYWGWRSGAAGLSFPGAAEGSFISGLAVGVTQTGGVYATCDEALAAVENDGYGSHEESLSRTISAGQSVELCGWNIAADGSGSGWSCRDLPGGDGTMPTGELGEIEPGLPDDPTDIPLDVPQTTEVINCLKDPACHNSGWEAPGPCDPTDIGTDPGDPSTGTDTPPGEGGGLDPGTGGTGLDPGAGTPVGGGVIDDGGGAITLPDEPPGYNDPTKPGGIGDGHRPGDEVCVEVASGFRVAVASISQAARSCLRDGTEQAWEADDPGILVPPRDGGCMDYAPGAACIDILKAEGWREVERTETIVRVCPPRTAKWFERGRRCGPIERTGPDPGGGIRIELPPCVPNHTRFEERTCYPQNGVPANIQDAIEDVLRDMSIDMSRVYFDSESDLTLRRPVCFPPAMRKRKALNYLLDLAGWGIFPAPDCTIIIGLDDPLPKVWTYHEDVDLLVFDLEWDRYEVFAQVMISRPDTRSRGGKLIEKGFSRMVPVQTSIGVEPDKIFPMNAPRGMSEAEAVQAARTKARQIARKGLPIIQFAVPHNYRMRKRHQLDIVRPTRGFRGRYMVTKLARDIDRKEGDLTVGQARWVVPETSL